ncbi:MAG: RagB/SusD family nutrient uptake outer membrane protein, partial [Duncaniella sp.]|nr:RagB/SusD family nutrient uptake outer membrane protein [Duncaniella sp.]
AKQYAIMRGEALGLRGMFHFDLLRLYGPVFAVSDQLECMPYQASSKREILPFLKASEVIDLVIKDLNEAADLLKGYDPIITEGAGLEQIVNNGISSYDDSFRQFRMNYYAVQALRARAYLWKGDKTKAYEIAKNDIIDAITTEDLTVFPWITKDATVTEGKPDLVFSTEVMFSLYHSKRTDLFYNTYFVGTLNKAARLTLFGEDLQANSKVGSLYESGDIRLNQWKIQEPSDSEKQEAEQVGGVASNSLAFLKYSPIESGTNTTGMEYYRYMVPLIRLSEVYLIAAECTTNRTEAFELINTLRAHRYIPDADPAADVEDLVFKEFYLETLGEGQIYFYYKRKAAATMLSGT